MHTFHFDHRLIRESLGLAAGGGRRGAVRIQFHAVALALGAALLGPATRAAAQTQTPTPTPTEARDPSDAASTSAAAAAAAAGSGAATPETRAALRRAADALAQVKGQKGTSRAEALDRAALAYRAVLDGSPADARGCAEASFQLGEIARRRGQLAEAEAAYAKAAELDFDRWGERALTERGHMLRRLKRFDEAVESYRRAATIRPSSARAHGARTWIGRCLQDEGDLDGAVQAHRQALEATTEPKRVIDVCNWLAKACLAKGDLDGAEAALARAEAVVPDGDSPEAESLKQAFDEMSARRALQRTKDEQNGATGDAEDLEKSTEKGEDKGTERATTAGADRAADKGNEKRKK